MPPQPETLDRETVYSLLADDVREYLIWYLSATGRTTVDETADSIVAQDIGPIPDVGEAGRTGVTIQLVHNHLPRLDEHDVVDYDPASDVVIPGENFGDLEPYVAELDPPLGSP